jgi:hypothetical protein
VLPASSTPPTPGRASTGRASRFLGTDLMCLSGCPMSKHFSAALTRARNALARQTSAHIVVLAVDAQVPIDADRARKRLLMDLPEPVVRINRLWNRGQGREGRASHSWRLVATRASLMRSLLVGMDQKLLGHLLHLLQGLGAMDLPALMRHSSGEIAPHRRSNRADAVGSRWAPRRHTRGTGLKRKGNHVRKHCRRSGGPCQR